MVVVILLSPPLSTITSRKRRLSLLTPPPLWTEWRDSVHWGGNGTSQGSLNCVTRSRMYHPRISTTVLGWGWWRPQKPPCIDWWPQGREKSPWLHHHIVQRMNLWTGCMSILVVVLSYTISYIPFQHLRYGVHGLINYKPRHCTNSRETDNTPTKKYRT